MLVSTLILGTLIKTFLGRVCSLEFFYFKTASELELEVEVEVEVYAKKEKRKKNLPIVRIYIK